MSPDGTASGRVALLIDFENLVRAVDEEDIDCEAVFRLADEYGRVLVANAYADWRMRDVNQYQADLYGLGIDLVHVFGQRRGALMKNAVDVKMAVDAVSLMSSLPHIDVYVIVSGDRDFIHVLKELRRHGKTVIGVSPDSAVSSDFSSLCDRFLRYEALTSTVEPTGAESIGEVRTKLAEIVRDNPVGLRGGEVKTMLRRALSSSFDESAYGFRSFGSFLGGMDAVVRVEPAPAAGGDLRVYPASVPTVATVETEDAATRLVRKAKLSAMRYEGMRSGAGRSSRGCSGRCRCRSSRSRWARCTSRCKSRTPRTHSCWGMWSSTHGRSLSAACWSPKTVRTTCSSGTGACR